jgi:hypothetical protein
MLLANQLVAETKKLVRRSSAAARPLRQGERPPEPRGT